MRIITISNQKGGVVLWIVPLVLFLYHYPKFLLKYCLEGLYFFFLLLAFEITALKTGQWIFPAGDFIGTVTMFGVTFPIEEFVIWMMIATPPLLSYYEFFADDRKLHHG